jgi:endo-1,4-beta-mannosidase
MNAVSREKKGPRSTLTCLLVIVAVMGIVATILPATEYIDKTTPGPVFTWNGKPFRPIGVNYFPATHPWLGMWTEFNATELENDLQVVKSLGGNCIRTFLQWMLVEPAMGTFNATIVNRVVTFFQVCSNADVAVIFTFFDFGPPSWAHCDRADEMFVNQTLIAREIAQLQLIVPLVKNCSATFVWDIRNEPASTRLTAAQFATWVQTISSTIRAMDGDHLVVVGGGYGNFENPELYVPYVDAVCMHFYKGQADPDWKREFESYLQAFKASGKPVILEEFGWPTYSGLHITESIQADYYRSIFILCDKHGIAGVLPWCLWEYPIPIDNPSENVYGILHPNGTWKPAAYVLHDYATGQLDTSSNFNGWEALF